nr:NAD-dependent epimerase/dehydratase family protein [Mesorhizobium sp.]
MRVVVTGAAGFVGNGLARHLVANPDSFGRPLSKLILADLAKGPEDPGGGAFAEWRCGDLASPVWLDAVFDEPVDCLFHLASIPGSRAERQPDLGWAVNLEAPLALARRLARQGRETGIVPRVVFASTIAVYGPLGPDPVTEDQPPRPVISYGAHKLMTEILLADLSRRGEIDARSVRLPGIVARPVSGSGHGSAFMSQLFYKAKAGEPYVCPVSRDAAAWWMSLETCVANLVHAARLDTHGLPTTRTWQLPALHARVDDIVAALDRQLGDQTGARVRFAPDEETERLFCRFPPLASPVALEAGFLRDRDANSLVESTLAGMQR